MQSARADEPCSNKKLMPPCAYNIPRGPQLVPSRAREWRTVSVTHEKPGGIGEMMCFRGRTPPKTHHFALPSYVGEPGEYASDFANKLYKIQYRMHTACCRLTKPAMIILIKCIYAALSLNERVLQNFFSSETAKKQKPQPSFLL